MDTNHNLEYHSLLDAHQDLKLQFIQSELDLALTFCEIADTTEDREKSNRNTENARRAYASASRTFVGSEPTPHERRDIADKMDRVEKLLENLPKP